MKHTIFDIYWTNHGDLAHWVAIDISSGYQHGEGEHGAQRLLLDSYTNNIEKPLIFLASLKNKYNITVRRNIMAWNLSGKMVENCTCNMLCPCWFGVKELMIMDQGYCAAPILFRIKNGSVDGVDLKGIDAVLAVDFPGPTILDGNATYRLYIDEAADEGQSKELEAIFQGKRGGPMEMISSLASKWLPTQRTKIDINDDGTNLTATVGGFGKMKTGGAEKRIRPHNDTIGSRFCVCI